MEDARCTRVSADTYGPVGVVVEVEVEVEGGVEVDVAVPAGPASAGAGLKLVAPPSPPSRKKPTNDPDFDLFWVAYPQPTDKALARKAWAKALSRGANPEELIAGAARYAAWNALPERPKYPATWLNNDCWENGYAQGKQRGNVVDRNRETLKVALDDSSKLTFAERMAQAGHPSLGGGS